MNYIKQLQADKAEALDSARSVDGKLRMDEWTDKQTNTRRTRLYLLVENWQFTQYRRKEESIAEAPVAATPPAPADAKKTKGKANK